MIFKKDDFLLGCIWGLLGPVLGFAVFKFARYRNFTLQEMYQWMTMNHNLITAWISVSLFANALIFTLYVNARIDRTAKGVFTVTVIYAITALLIKLLG